MDDSIWIYLKWNMMLLKWQNITQPWLGQDCFHWFSVPLDRVSYVNATLIAHIWSNFDDKNAASGVVQCDLSDHYAMFANFPSNSVSKNEKKEIYRRRHTTEAHDSFWAEL